MIYLLLSTHVSGSLLTRGRFLTRTLLRAMPGFFREHFESGQMEEWVCEDDGRIVATGAILWFRFPPSFTNGMDLRHILPTYTLIRSIGGRVLRLRFLRSSRTGQENAVLAVYGLKDPSGDCLYTRNTGSVRIIQF